MDYLHPNLQSILPNFFAYGLCIGLLFAVVILMCFFGIYQSYWNRDKHGGYLFLYNAIAILCYSMFSIYTISVHFRHITEIISPQILFTCQVFLPIGLLMSSRMYVHSIPTKSMRAFLFWQKNKTLYRIVDCLYVVCFISLVYLNDSNIIMTLSIVLCLINVIVGWHFVSNAFRVDRLAKIYSFALLSLIVLFVALLLMLLSTDLQNLMKFDAPFVWLHLTLSILILICSFILSANIFSRRDSAVNISPEKFHKHIYYALEHDEFYLEYQPKISLLTKKVTGIEALIRWRHGKKGILSPFKFIPISEQSDIINHICRWVINQVLRDFHTLHKHGIDMPVAINFSVRNINLEMVSFLEKKAKEYKIPTSMITIEITESLFLHMSKEQSESLKLIKSLGFRLSLDDFSAGFSSLQHLEDMDLDELKIDRVLTSRVMTAGKNTVITTIMNMCHSLGIEVVAEGIENHDVQKVLSDMKCEMAQGFGICRPKTVYDFIDWYDKYKHA